MNSPGGANDVRAYDGCNLSSMVESLPYGYYIVGDNAYVATEHLLTPFAGRSKNDPTKDAFNFHLSQMRIRIEQAFGFFTNKWRVFRRPSELNLKNASLLVHACMRMHNYCIDNREFVPPEVILNPSEFEPDFEATHSTEVQSNGRSYIRNRICEFIKQNGFERPFYNVQRNS